MLRWWREREKEKKFTDREVYWKINLRRFWKSDESPIHGLLSDVLERIRPETGRVI